MRRSGRLAGGQLLLRKLLPIASPTETSRVMGSSRVCAPAPNPCPGRLLHSDDAAVTRSGQPWRSRPASSPATFISRLRAVWSTSWSSSPTVRMSREVSGICVVSKSASSTSAKPLRWSASKVACLPDQVAQVDHQLGAVDHVGAVGRERPGEFLRGREQLQRGLPFEVLLVDVGQLVVLGEERAGLRLYQVDAETEGLQR